MEIKRKRIPIKNEDDGRNKISMIRELYGNKADEIKIINEISFNVPIYNFGTDDILFYADMTSDWCLEFPEEIIIKT